MEMMQVNEEYKEDELNEFKKYLLKAQNINEDLELSKIISDDMNAVWENVGDQEKMYKSFPFSITFESVHKEYDDTLYNSNELHHVTESFIRSYALDYCGGIGIIAKKTLYHPISMKDDNSKNKEYYDFNVITLGEDDGYHFLICSRLFEPISTCSIDRFIKLLSMCFREYKKYVGKNK